MKISHITTWVLEQVSSLRRPAMASGAAALLCLAAIGVAATGTTAAGASGTVLYVATPADGGTNGGANTCTDPSTPCATIVYALSQGTAGDTITVGAGTFNESQLVLTYPVTIDGAGASSTTIDATSTSDGCTTPYAVILSSVPHSCGGANPALAAGAYAITGATVEGVDGVSASAADNPYLVDLVALPTGTTVDLVHDDFVTNTTIDPNVATDTSYGVYAQPSGQSSSPTSSITVDHDTFSGMSIGVFLNPFVGQATVTNSSFTGLRSSDMSTRTYAQVAVGINMLSAGSTMTAGDTISGDTFSGYSGFGVIAESGVGATAGTLQHVSITDNTFDLPVATYPSGAATATTSPIYLYDTSTVGVSVLSNVEVTSNSITSSGTTASDVAVYVGTGQTFTDVTVEDNNLLGGKGVVGLSDPDSASLDGSSDYWGCSSGPSTGTCTTIVGSNVTTTPYWTTSDGVPTAPTDVIATAGLGTAAVSWGAPALSGTSDGTLTGYVVTPLDQTTGSSGSPVTVTAPATTATVTGLTDGDGYTFTVTAANGVGTSAASSASDAVVPLATSPAASASSGTTIPASGTATTGTVADPAVPGGTISASAQGPPGTPGSVSVATYTTDPLQGLVVGSAYYDVLVAPGSTFTSLSVQVCGVPTGTAVEWWDATIQSLVPVSDQAPVTGQPGCVTLTITATTTPSLGDLTGTVFVVAPSPPAPTSGYWEVASDGGIFSFGSPGFHGSMGATHLNAPVVGMAEDPATGGYWLVASDGGVYSFTAPFYGSMGGQHLNAPIVGMAATTTGHGYWLVASDGGVFSFGSATFDGSMGATHLNAPVVGMAEDQATGGYWLVASDGGIFSFTAPFHGSMGGARLDAPMVGMAAS
jgi:hypothetical protein